MKKIIALLTSLILVISIVACGSGNADTTTDTTDTTGATTEAKDFSALKSEGTLSMGTYYGASASEMMTFQIYLTFNANGTFVLTNGTDEKGSGTYALADGVYTLSFGEGKTTNFIVKADGTILVTTDLYYGKASISIDYVDDIILSYQGASSSSTEDTTATTSTPAATASFSIAAGTYTGNYEKVSAMAGNVNYVYTVTVGVDGTFSYSVKFAMGETEYDGSSASGTYTVENNVFKFTDAEGNVTEGTLTADNTLVISLKASAMASAPYEVTLTQNSGFALSAGTYKGNYEKVSAMAGNVNYVYTATVGADGTFSYSVKFAMGETEYDGSSASGTYTVTGNAFTFTDAEGNVTEGTLTADNTLVISLKASAMASTPYEVTLVLE